jgi:hypothetical protein
MSVVLDLKVERKVVSDKLWWNATTMRPVINPRQCDRGQSPEELVRLEVVDEKVGRAGQATYRCDRREEDERRESGKLVADNEG